MRVLTTCFLAKTAEEQCQELFRPFYVKANVRMAPLVPARHQGNLFEQFFKVNGDYNAGK